MIGSLTISRSLHVPGNSTRDALTFKPTQMKSFSDLEHKEAGVRESFKKFSIAYMLSNIWFLMLDTLVHTRQMCEPHATYLWETLG